MLIMITGTHASNINMSLFYVQQYAIAECTILATRNMTHTLYHLPLIVFLLPKDLVFIFYLTVQRYRDNSSILLRLDLQKITTPKSLNRNLKSLQTLKHQLSNFILTQIHAHSIYFHLYGACIMPLCYNIPLPLSNA